MIVVSLYSKSDNNTNIGVEAADRKILLFFTMIVRFGKVTSKASPMQVMLAMLGVSYRMIVGCVW